MIETGVIHGRFQVLHNDHLKYLMAGKSKGIGGDAGERLAEVFCLVMARRSRTDAPGVCIRQVQRGKRQSRVRAIICCLAFDKLKISGANVARKLQLSPSAVSSLAARGRVDSITKRIEGNLFDFN